MQCKYCNSQIKDSAKICPFCGRSVSSSSEGMRHDADAVFEHEASYQKPKQSAKKTPKTSPKPAPKPANTDEYFDDKYSDSDSSSKSKSGIKAVIIIAVAILVLAAGVFFLFKGGYLDSLIAKVSSGKEITTEDTGATVKADEPTVTPETTTKAQDYKTGYYKVTKKGGAGMFTSNKIYSESAFHIAASDTYVEIKAFLYEDGYTLGFAADGTQYFGWLKMTDVEYAPDYKPQSEANNTTKSAETTKRSETTTKKPAETTTKAPETTTYKYTSTGRYAVSDSVGDSLNVRKGPGTSYDVVKELKIGDKVTVVEWNGNWAHITVNGEDIGYVSGTYLDKD